MRFDKSINPIPHPGITFYRIWDCAGDDRYFVTVAFPTSALEDNEIGFRSHAARQLMMVRHDVRKNVAEAKRKLDRAIAREIKATS